MATGSAVLRARRGRTPTASRPRFASGRKGELASLDLLVPVSVRPEASQGTTLWSAAGHDSRAVRIVKGLDGAIVEAEVMRLAVLDESEQRVCDLRVAGFAGPLAGQVELAASCQMLAGDVLVALKS